MEQTKIGNGNASVSNSVSAGTAFATADLIEFYIVWILPFFQSYFENTEFIFFSEGRLWTKGRAPSRFCYLHVYMLSQHQVLKYKKSLKKMKIVVFTYPIFLCNLGMEASGNWLLLLFVIGFFLPSRERVMIYGK